MDSSRCSRNDNCAWWTEVVDGQLSLLKTFQRDTSVVFLFVLCFEVDLVLFEPYVRFQSFSKVWVTI